MYPFFSFQQFHSFVQHTFIIKFCCSLVDGNRKPENRFESYEDLLQKKRAQERKYRSEIKTLTTIIIMSSFLPERVLTKCFLSFLLFYNKLIFPLVQSGLYNFSNV